MAEVRFCIPTGPKCPLPVNPLTHLLFHHGSITGFCHRRRHRLYCRTMVPTTQAQVHQGHSRTTGQLVTRSVPYCSRMTPHAHREPPGNELDIWWQDQLGETDFRWMAEYGNAWRVGGCFGVRTRSIHQSSCVLVADCPDDRRHRRTCLCSPTQRRYSTYLGATTTPSVQTLDRRSVC